MINLVRGFVKTESKDTATRLDEATSKITFVGKAPVGSDPASPVWKIMKIEEIGNELIVTWANGKNSTTNIWNNRASIPYI